MLNPFKQLLLAAHPVGSYYWSSEPKDPSKLFGGTWEPVKDRFVLAAGDEHEAGTTGGEETHTLTIDEMPSHSHRIKQGTTNAYTTSSVQAGYQNEYLRDGTIENTGGDQPHNNMPPYIVAYCWRRTA